MFNLRMIVTCHEVMETRIASALPSPVQGGPDGAQLVPTGNHVFFGWETELPFAPFAGMGLVFGEDGSAVTLATICWDMMHKEFFAPVIQIVERSEYDDVQRRLLAAGATRLSQEEVQGILTERGVRTADSSLVREH